MKDKLIGDDAIIVRVLDKVELAIHRAVEKNHLYPADALETLAAEIHKISKEMHDDRS